MYDFAASIFPFNRSITGKGVRQTLNAIDEYIKKAGAPALEMKKIASGTKVFDWTVPKEWDVKSAYIEDEAHNRIVDMEVCNLHVLGYSTPVDEWVELEKLLEHVYTLPEQPDLIPYVTSYYRERFGFCMSENQKKSLKPGKYHMVIDSQLFDGNLDYGEVVIKGQTDEEVFFTTYDCHPSMGNNECSGPALIAELIAFVAQLKNRRYTYRFIIVPETIGAIAYLATDNHLQHLKEHMIAGFNLSCVGDNRTYSMVHTKYADTLADRVLENVLKFHTDDKFDNYSFLHRGSDERQYNSAGVDLPVVCFCRSKFGAYPEYHTSADDMNLISSEGFQGAYEVMTKVVKVLEYNDYYVMNVCCEPQLGKRGLFPDVSKKGSYDAVMGLMHFMTYADGRNDLIAISDITGYPVDLIIEDLDKLLNNGLVKRRD